MHVYTSIQITGSSIRQTDQRPAEDGDGTIAECSITRVPIDSSTHCDIVHATSEHATCHIRGTTHTWVFALLVGPMCKTLRIRMDAHIYGIVPMYIRLPLQGTTITIQSLRDRFVVRTCTLSPRILPYVVRTTPPADGTGIRIVIPTLGSQLVVNSWNHDHGLIRNWEDLMMCNHGLVRVHTIIGAPALNTSVSAMYTLLTTKLFKSMHEFNRIFDPGALHKTYTNLARLVSSFNACVSKTHKQTEEVIHLKELLAARGYDMELKTELEFDIGSMLCGGSDILISYD
jgi:hypothetical protein